jgi:putative resolvase
VVRIEPEIASGMNGGRRKARRLLADPKFCARLCGRRSARNRAEKALEAAAADD